MWVCASSLVTRYYCLQATSVLAHSFSRDLRVRSPPIHHVSQRLWVLQGFPWLLPAFAPRKLDISHVSISKQHRQLLCQSYDFWFLDVLGGWSNNSVIYSSRLERKRALPGVFSRFFSPNKELRVLCSSPSFCPYANPVPFNRADESRGTPCCSYNMVANTYQQKKQTNHGTWIPYVFQCCDLTLGCWKIQVLSLLGKLGDEPKCCHFPLRSKTLKKNNCFWVSTHPKKMSPSGIHKLQWLMFIISDTDGQIMHT